MAETDLERRHQALIERDRLIGLAAEAESARAHAARLQEQLDVARSRLDRKNARIRQLAERVAVLEGGGAPPPMRAEGLGRRLLRVARRSDTVDEE